MFMNTPSNLSPHPCGWLSRREQIGQGTGRRTSRLADIVAMAL
jgi:hypothetical protein